MDNLKEQLQNITNGHKNNELKLEEFKQYLIEKMKDSAYKGKNKIKIRSLTLWFDGFNNKEIIDMACKWLDSEGIKAHIKEENEETYINNENKTIRKKFLCISWE